MQINMNHPIYGFYELGWKFIPQFPNYEMNENSQVRNRISNMF